MTNERADPGEDTLQVSSPDEHPPVRGKGGASVAGIGVGPGSEPGPRRPRLGVPQSDEPVGLPPAGQQSSMRGGVKRPMCGFPSKQYLELQRRVSVRAGCRGRAASHRPFAGGCRADGELVACSSPNLTAGGGHRARAGAAVTETAMAVKDTSESKHLRTKRDRKVENSRGLADSIKDVTHKPERQYLGGKTRTSADQSRRPRPKQQKCQKKRGAERQWSRSKAPARREQSGPAGP